MLLSLFSVVVPILPESLWLPDFESLSLTGKFMYLDFAFFLLGALLYVIKEIVEDYTCNHRVLCFFSYSGFSIMFLSMVIMVCLTLVQVFNYFVY